MKYLQFIRLCAKAYSGDPEAALAVLKILANRLRQSRG